MLVLERENTRAVRGKFLERGREEIIKVQFFRKDLYLLENTYKPTQN